MAIAPTLPFVFLPMPSSPQLASQVRELLFQGIVIPAHPLALDRNRRFDERRQRALTRYYLDAGAKGIAIGVHTTQFEIRKPEVGLYQPVLELGAETIREFEKLQETESLRLRELWETQNRLCLKRGWPEISDTILPWLV